MDAVIALANSIVKTEYSDIPKGAVDAVKKDILDTLGVAVAGSRAAGARD